MPAVPRKPFSETTVSPRGRKNGCALGDDFRTGMRDIVPCDWASSVMKKLEVAEGLFFRRLRLKYGQVHVKIL